MSPKTKVYVKDWVLGRGSNSKKIIVIDLRNTDSKLLPKRKTQSREEFMKLVVDVCRDIDELRKRKSWSEIGEIYGVSRLTIRNWYIRYCGDRNE